jgi:putative flippase GtrA
MINQLVRYGITSLSGLTLNLLLLSALVEVARMGEIIAAVVSTVVTLLITFSGVERWVFSRQQAQSRRIIIKRASAYYLIMAVGKAINIMIYSILLWLNIWYPIAWLIGSGMVFGGTFVMNRYFWNKTAS